MPFEAGFNVPRSNVPIVHFEFKLLILVFGHVTISIIQMQLYLLTSKQYRHIKIVLNNYFFKRSQSFFGTLLHSKYKAPAGKHRLPATWAIEMWGGGGGGNPKTLYYSAVLTLSIVAYPLWFNGCSLFFSLLFLSFYYFCFNFALIKLIYRDCFRVI